MVAICNDYGNYWYFPRLNRQLFVKDMTGLVKVYMANAVVTRLSLFG